MTNGIYSPPDPLPNPEDLGMGRYTNNFVVLDFTNPQRVKEWAQIVGWFKYKGAPIASEVFFTAYVEGPSDKPYSPTAVIFANANGDQVQFDATMCYNNPSVHLQQLKMAYNFGDPGVTEVWPGFDAINAQTADPVGPPMPSKNTPGWSQPFARYNSVSMNFNPDLHVVGYRFERLNGELYERLNISGGMVNGPFGGTSTIPVWERLR